MWNPRPFAADTYKWGPTPELHMNLASPDIDMNRAVTPAWHAELPPRPGGLPEGPIR